jgi:hypothetical protein
MTLVPLSNASIIEPVAPIKIEKFGVIFLLSLFK